LWAAAKDDSLVVSLADPRASMSVLLQDKMWVSPSVGEMVVLMVAKKAGMKAAKKADSRALKLVATMVVSTAGEMVVWTVALLVETKAVTTVVLWANVSVAPSAFSSVG